MVFLKALLTLSSQGTKGSVTIIQAAKRIWVMRQPVATFFWNPADLDILERVKGRSDPTLTCSSPNCRGQGGPGGSVLRDRRSRFCEFPCSHVISWHRNVPAWARETCDHAPPVRRPAASAGAKAGAGPFAPLLGRQKWNLVLSECQYT
jgi:hypothetical protein